MEDTTIVAIATGLTNAGISIIRLSGAESFAIADKVFVSPSGKRLSEAKTHTIHYGHIVDKDEIIDEVMVSVMRSPKTYTREDVVEINCHGGITVTKKVFDIIVRNGAKIAEPGEFTKRAFLNGRIDLSEAESVIDVINSKNTFALKSSMNNLCGRLSELISSTRDKILKDTAYIEAALDDPEHISLDGFTEELSSHISEELGVLERLRDDFANGRFIKDGIKTVIIGKPNSGKSSLLNLLLGTDRAIVTDIAGTTRDTIEETVTIDGITLNIIDTAGIRETDNVVEKLGVEKSVSLANEADLILFVVDSAAGLDESDREIFELIKDKKYLLLYNKVDLHLKKDREEIEKICSDNIIDFSAKDGIGLAELKNRIVELFFNGSLSINDEVFLSNERQRNEVIDAIESLNNVSAAIEDGLSEDFFTIDLMNAYISLGLITGDNVEEDLVNKIFSDFCMGK